MATSFNCGRSRSTRREPPTMGKQLINFITCGCESSAPYFGTGGDVMHWLNKFTYIQLLCNCWKNFPFYNDLDIDSPTRDFIHSISSNIEFCDAPVLGGESANCSLSYCVYFNSREYITPAWSPIESNWLKDGPVCTFRII